MIEMHIWLTIRETYKNDTDENEEKVIYDIQKLIKELNRDDIQLKRKNGENYLEFSMFANRKTKEIVEIKKFLENVVFIAKGSYGMIYCWDDEDEYGKDNEFQIYVIKKGKIVEEKDNYLSPCIPTIEEEYVE